MKQESVQGTSLRTDSLADYNNEIFTETDIDFIDYRSFNICNFKCRSCTPQFSHGIANEVKKNLELQPFFPKPTDSKTISVDDTNVQWIKENLYKLNRLMFTGGEPTRIPGVQELIEYICKHHRKIQIIIVTNASFSDKFWYDITETLPNMHWTVSIDAVGSPAEIIRHGTKWDLVEKNVKWLAQNANSLDINTVVSNLNLFHLGPLLEFGRRMQRLSITPTGKHGDLGCRHQFTVCQRPFHMSVDNLSEELLKKADQYLKHCVDLDLDDEQRNMLEGVQERISSASYDDDLWKTTQRYNNVINTIRNENHEVLF